MNIISNLIEMCQSNQANIARFWNKSGNHFICNHEVHVNRLTCEPHSEKQLLRVDDFSSQEWCNFFISPWTPASFISSNSQGSNPGLNLGFCKILEATRNFDLI